MKDISVTIDNVIFNYRVALLIERANEILVECNPKNSFVVLPGGRVKTLENSVNAIQREIKEEMGIELNKTELEKKAIIENFFEFDGKKYHELLFLYKLSLDIEDKRLKTKLINLDSKSNYYEWVKKDKLKEVNLLPRKLIDIVNTKEFQTIVINDLK